MLSSLSRKRGLPMPSLDLTTQTALHGVPPQVAWDQIQAQVFQAFEHQQEEADALLEKYQPPYDQTGLDLALQNLDPKVGLNNFQYIAQGVKLDQIMKAKPLEVLEQVLRMVTISDKWQSEVST